MFSRTDEALRKEDYMSIAKLPYLEYLQMQGIAVNSDGSVNQEGTSLAFFVRQSENLSKSSAEQLYGENFSMSATKVDNFFSCPYKYFLRNGLKLEPRVPAEFDASTAGNFTHYVLENVFDEIKNGVGFKDIDEDICLKVTEKYINKFVNEILIGFEGKGARFEYLFKRYKNDVEHVVRDMVNELRKSKFEPLDVELDISKLSDEERGYIDRVDGYEHDGRLYLRIIDYKTRKKAYSFDLDDVYYGRDMQMLIYLFALEKHGKTRYGKEVEPVGVLYVPARDVILSAARNASDEEIQKQRTGEMRRSGLILRDISVIDAMESGSLKEYLPVKTSKDGDFTGESLISASQFGMLSEHVRNMMQNAKENISNGNNECSPYYKSENDNACNYCDYRDVCGFDEEIGDKHRYVVKKDPEEVWKEFETRNK